MFSLSHAAVDAEYPVASRRQTLALALQLLRLVLPDAAAPANAGCGVAVGVATTPNAVLANQVLVASAMVVAQQRLYLEPQQFVTYLAALSFGIATGTSKLPFDVVGVPRISCSAHVGAPVAAGIADALSLLGDYAIPSAMQVSVAAFVL